MAKTEQTVTITHLYRAYPTKHQEPHLHRCVAASRAMSRRVLYEPGISIPRISQAKRKIEHRWVTTQRDEFRFWATDDDGVRRRYPYSSVPNVVLRGAQRRVASAFESYHAKRAKGDTKAKQPKRARGWSFAYQEQHLEILETPNKKFVKLRFPQPNDKRYRLADPYIKIRLHRPLPENAKIEHVTFTYDRDKNAWYVGLTVTYPVDVDRLTRGTVAVGVDRGITVPIAVHAKDLASREVLFDYLAPHSNACKCAADKPLHAPCQNDPTGIRIRDLQRRVARSHHLNSPACWDEHGAHIKGGCPWRRRKSKNVRKFEAEIRRLKAKQTRLRREQNEQLSHDLVFGSDNRNVQGADTIVFENLKITNMMRSASGTVDEPGSGVAQKRGLNRRIQGMAWGDLKKRTTDKARLAALDGRDVIVTDVPPQNTSRRCPACKHTEKKNRSGQRFACRKCGYTGHADTVGATNVLEKYIDQIECL